MLNEDDLAHLVLQLDDLETDLRNGNIPESEKVIASLGNFLMHKQPLDWPMLATFLIDNLDKVQIRTSLLHFLPEVKEVVCPFQPEQEAETSC